MAMIRSKRLDDSGVAALKPTSKRVTIPDPELRGHYIRITPNGTKSFWAVARDPSGKQHWKLIGSPPMKVDDARAKAGHIIRSIRAAVASEVVDSVSFEGVANLWFERHVVKSGLRSEHKQKLFLRKHIIPAFAGMAFADVRRKHITELLDQLEDKNGKRQADYGLAIISGICSWYAKRDEEYNSPIIKGMKRQGDNRRSRILNDAELAAVWREADGMFGNLVKFALLTGQRKDKYLTMRWDDVLDGVWHIRSEDREKGHGGQLSLPPMALAILEEQRRENPACPFVFAGPVGKPLSQIGRRKDKLDAVVKIPHWTIHDLRRTSRSLMAAAGVPDLVAELVLGHAQKGVAGIYNRHDYRDEKADALKRLAQQITDIVIPPPSNVRRLHG
jgi:integrase